MIHAAAAFIFDLDGTLYSTKALDEANRHAVVLSVAEHLSLSSDDATKKLTSAIGNFNTATGRPSLYGSALSLGVPDEAIARFQHRLVQPARMLNPDPELAELLARLSRVAKLALLTNTRTSIAKKALDALGIIPGIFKKVWGGELLRKPKPNGADIIALCAALGVSPREAISVGDRWSVDLAPAAEAGLMIRKVSDRDDLVKWLKTI